MKRTARRLSLRADTIRALTAQELRRVDGGFITTALITVCLTCGDSCTADLRTT